MIYSVSRQLLVPLYDWNHRELDHAFHPLHKSCINTISFFGYLAIFSISIIELVANVALDCIRTFWNCKVSLDFTRFSFHTCYLTSMLVYQLFTTGISRLPVCV